MSTEDFGGTDGGSHYMAQTSAKDLRTPPTKGEPIEVQHAGKWVQLTVTHVPEAPHVYYNGVDRTGMTIAFELGCGWRRPERPDAWLQESLRSASAEVATWPEWKRAAMRVLPTRHTERAPGLCVDGCEGCEIDRAEWRSAVQDAVNASRLIQQHVADLIEEQRVAESQLMLAMHWGADATGALTAMQQYVGILERELNDARMEIAALQAWPMAREITRLRDRLAVEQHRSALRDDVVDAAKRYWIAHALKAPTCMERYEQLESATRLLLESEGRIAAGRPGAGEKGEE